ncbi:sodium-dependent bicarbonate transport family permease [soil metagenome]
MTGAGIIAANLLSPIVLAFALGMVAALLRSDLEFPEALYHALTIYLLLAIGLKGGIALAATPLSTIALPLAATVVLGVVTPLTAFAVLRWVGRLDAANAAAIAAHYGSVSAVTFLAAQTFATAAGDVVEGYLPALVAVLEVPAIIVALLLVGRRTEEVAAKAGGGWSAALREVMTGRSVVLLVGGVLIGYVADPAALLMVEPFFIGLFPGALTLFLLELGMVAARRLRDLRSAGPFLLGFALAMPVLHGCLGVWVGQLAGLSTGGSAIFGAMVGSASYIAAPAAVRIALPQANPAFYLTTSLGVTFPFNLTLGIPLYFAFARWIA